MGGLIGGFFKTALLFAILIVVAGWLAINWFSSLHGGGAPSAPGQAGGGSGVSVGQMSNPNTGCSPVCTAQSASWPQMPPLTPTTPTHPGLVAFAYETATYGNVDALEQIGNGSTAFLGHGPWRPLRAGEMRLMDDDAGGLRTGRAKAFIMRGDYLTAFGGDQTIALRLTHGGFSAPAACTLHILINGQSYVSERHVFPRGTPPGRVMTVTPNPIPLAPAGAVDIGFAYDCAEEGGGQQDLHDIFVDPIMKSPNTSERLLLPSDFVYPAAAL